MARPQEFDKKRELAQRAAGILEREGVSISVERLARELEIKRPTLLYHFPTYGHILETVLGELLLAQARFVHARVEAAVHPIDKIYAHLLAVFDFHRGNEGHLLFLTQALAATSGARIGEILRGASGLLEGSRKATAERIRAGIKAGIVQPCDPDALVALLRAVIDGLTIQSVTAGEFALESDVHTMFWERVLLPLKRAPKTTQPANRPRAKEQVSRHSKTHVPKEAASHAKRLKI